MMEVVLWFKPSLLPGVQPAASLCPTEAATLHQGSHSLCAWVWAVLRLGRNSLHQALAGGLITGTLDIFSWVEAGILPLGFSWSQRERKFIWLQLTFHTGWNLEFRVSDMGWRTPVEKNHPPYGANVLWVIMDTCYSLFPHVVKP